MVDANAYAWTRNMKRLLQETGAKVSRRERKCLTRMELANLRKRYRNILTRGKKELPLIPPKPSTKRGKLTKSDAHNLWERMKTHEKAVLLFAKDPHVAFTNNRAEHDLRMAKVKQKVSGCFRVTLYPNSRIMTL
ncbi:MAG: transposase [Candidatus Thiodiazotropha sp. (ex Lucinoma kastoroae)]|nr:transposase [Candidatus Thiodiazotropha sp. (ex Lucinoma kastoroae)]